MIKITESKKRLCLKGLELKEDGEDIVVKGYAATTHPDNVGDILSEKAIQQIVDCINDTSKVGGNTGSYRSVSLFHDWVKEEDPTLDEAGFISPNAKKVRLDDGHYAAEIEAKINKFYKGNMSPEEIKYRIDNNQIAGFSIEYDTDNSKTKTIDYNGEQYRFIEELSEFGGVGFARARMIANPHAVIYKEIEERIVKQNKEVEKMSEEEKQSIDIPEESSEKLEEVVEESNEEEVSEASSEEDSKEEKIEEESSEELESKEVKINIKEIEKSIKKQVLDELKIKSRVIKNTKEDELKMETKEKISLSVKEMKESINNGKVDLLQFKEAASNYFAEHPEFDAQLQSTGIPLKTTMKVKCDGTKLRIVGGLQVKSVLDQDTNAGAYTESIVEFADLFVPGLVDTFNNQTNLFGALRKVDHLMGGNQYGWKIKADQASSLSVDPDDPSVVFDPVSKYKLHTAIKEYRVGVSVTDYVMYHARATMGDLLMIEAEARMNDLMRDINNDLFTEQVDTAGNKILGLEAVADSAGNTEMYGKTRSTANRLAPDAAGNTYTEVSGALTTSYMRSAARYVEIEGALRSNLRYVMGAAQRDALFELEDGSIRYGVAPRLGFDGQPSFDGIPMIIDSSCQTDAVFVIDNESYYIVISRAPQLIGLAKVGAAESAYISVYLAAVYEQPRRIHMLNLLS